MPANEEWIWSDEWFLAAAHLADKGDGCDLAALVQAADYLEHAVITDEEISRAVDRLVPAGLLEVSDGWFHLTPSGRQLAEAKAAARRSGRR